MALPKKTYSEKLKDPRWQKKRLEILDRDSFTCKLCGDEETTLNVHHLKYTGQYPWDIDSDFLITYCEDCHRMVEYYKDYGFPIERVFKLITPIGILLFVQVKDEINLELYDKKKNIITELHKFDITNMKFIGEYFNPSSPF